MNSAKLHQVISSIFLMNQSEMWHNTRMSGSLKEAINQLTHKFLSTVPEKDRKNLQPIIHGLVSERYEQDWEPLSNIQNEEDPLELTPEIMECTLLNLREKVKEPGPLWAVVRDTFGFGSQSSIAFCKRYKVDPELENEGAKYTSEGEVMTAAQFVDLVCPEHGRTSCSDKDLNNGLYSRDGKNWYGRCSRCMLLEILKDGQVPKDFEFSECNG